MLLKLIEDYNVKILSTKVFWENPEEREIYKNFWSDYGKAKTSEEKEILALKRELYDLNKEDNIFERLRNLYKNKLVEYGLMRKLKNQYTVKYTKENN